MKKIKTSLMIAVLAVLAIALNSCVEDEPYLWDVTGTWQLDENQYGIVSDWDVVKYQFNPDGTGAYGYFDNRGQWWSEPILWMDGVRGINTLQVTYQDGSYDIYYYKMDGAGNLIISNSPGFYNWELFIPTYM